MRAARKKSAPDVRALLVFGLMSYVFTIASIAESPSASYQSSSHPHTTYKSKFRLKELLHQYSNDLHYKKQELHSPLHPMKYW